ncbi:unnamed protein product [Meloidogyne enterolobii]|uniref:Uncharacterized protein n=1 Tax=Meloidogyne enterolobii TaxID=390850 RepID=A0ACB0YCJ6_MELEN
MLKNREQNRRRRMDQSWIQQSVMRRQAGDIYAFGIVMYEILFRDLPFPRNVDLSGQFVSLFLAFNWENLLNYCFLREKGKGVVSGIINKGSFLDIHPNLSFSYLFSSSNICKRSVSAENKFFACPNIPKN